MVIDFGRWKFLCGTNFRAGNDKHFLEIPAGWLLSDFDGDGVGDLALLKASHYMVVSTESGEFFSINPLRLRKNTVGRVSL